ncbi:MAG: thioesterase [Acidimicrobiales bacterium]|nr:MAG: thioesterase [Acidimicrobiales bacterium]
MSGPESADNPTGASILDLLQPDVIEQADGRAVFCFMARPEWTIPSGQVQGGIVAAMLDMTMAFSADDLSTVSLHVDYLRPAFGPELTVTATVTRRGRRVIFAEAEMVDQEGRLIARGRQNAVPID